MSCDVEQQLCERFTSSIAGSNVAVDDSGDVFWIVPTVIASVLAFVVCILVVVLVSKTGRHNGQAVNEVVYQAPILAPNAPQNHYADRLSDIVQPESRSQYGELSTRERDGV
jgi:hypothetical protein